MTKANVGAKASKNEAINGLGAELRKLTQKMFNEKGEPIYFISRAEEVGFEKHLSVHYSTLQNKKVIIFKVVYNQKEDDTAKVYPYSDDLVWTQLYKGMTIQVSKYNVKADADNIVNTYLNE